MAIRFKRSMARHGAGATSAALAVAALAGASPAEACPTDPYLGSVCTTVASYCPHGYAEMLGQLEAISDYSALYSLLGCTWGGDCRNSFGIPDMRGRAAAGAGQGPGLSDLRLGMMVGREDTAISIDEMPAHSHTATFTAHNLTATLSAYDGNGASPKPDTTNRYLQTVAQNALIPNTQANLYGSGTGAEVVLSGLDVNLFAEVTVGSTGGSQLVDIQSPVMALTYCIALEGMYPPRQ
jgi:microcystin-dependent protein